MSRGQESIFTQHGCYYLTFNVIDGTDIFVKPVFKQIIVESLNYFTSKKGLVVYGWCLMTNHLQLIAEARDGNNLTSLASDFKKFTTRIILEDIEAESEIRRAWIMKRFRKAGPLQFFEKFQVWETGTDPVFIDPADPDIISEYLELIHGKPLRDRIVSRAEDYIHSSARDYAGIEGLVNVRLYDRKDRLVPFSLVRHSA